jgi:hypothetical protein
VVWGEESGGGFSLVEHPIPPRTLAAPMHRHANEDEYSYVLEGRSSATRWCTPRRGPWSSSPAGSGTRSGTPATGRAGSSRSSPSGGFEHLFKEAAEGPEATSGETVPLNVRYGIEFDYESIERLCEQHGLGFPDE